MKTLSLRFVSLLLLLMAYGHMHSQCGVNTPSFIVNLSASPSMTYVSPNTVRNDTCCGGLIAGECVKFIITLHPGAMGINFGFASGAVPPGALFYQINCDTTVYPVGTPVCLNGAGPHVLTFCKPGGNANTYSITSIAKPSVPDSVLVRNGCTQTLTVNGFSIPTITWTAVPPSTLYNSFLSCTVGCATVVVTPTGTALPPSVKYLVSGYGQSPCLSNFYSDTIEVFFYNDLLAGINPVNPTLCFGQNNAILTVTASGGLAPHSYTWSTSANTNTIMVGPGIYTVLVSDKTGCPPASATMQVFSFTLPITALAGANQTLCVTNPNAALNGTILSASGGIWSGGGGVFSPTTTALSATYQPTSTELSAGSVQLYLTSTGNAGCAPDQDTIVLFFQKAPQIAAVSDVTVCGNNALVNLSSTITVFPATAQWSTTGTGSFSAPNNTVTTYMPSAADILAGQVNVVVTTSNNGVCGNDADTVTIIITPAPVVNAGTDHTICSSAAAALNGLVSGATTTGSWSTSGNGVFTPNVNTLNGSYTPGTLDKTNGTVTLVLTSTGNNNCLAVRDTVKIIIRNQPTVTAGPNFQVCSTPGNIALSGTVTGATNTGSWSTGGSGAFGQPVTTLPNSYSASNADKLAGTIIFTLTSTNNGPCPATIDTLMIRIRALAIVSAGANSVICTTQGVLALTGTVTMPNPAGGVWSTGGSGTLAPGSASFSASYSLSGADLNAGFVTFTLTSAGNGVCPAVADSIRLNIVQQPTVTAGINKAYCSTAGSFVLTGTSAGSASGVIWTGGAGNIISPNTTTTTYQFNQPDLANGSVIFTITSVNNTICPSASDTVMIRITPQPSVNAGIIPAICSTQSTIALTGTLNGGTGTATWSAGGSGSLFNQSNLLATYSVSTGDINLGYATFTLTSSNNGPCLAERDSVMVRIIKTATVSAGGNQNVCSNVSAITLTGNILGPNSSVQWTSSNANGIFTPGNTALNTSYALNSIDILKGSVIFTLTSTVNGPCPANSDTVLVTITTLATVNSGGNKIICSSANTVNLSGTVNGSSSTGNWTSSGGGSFSPASTDLNVIYSLSAADILAGMAVFTLTSTDNKACPPVSDSVKVLVQAQPTVNAGKDVTLCSNQQGLTLGGQISGFSSTGIWSATGTGSISPANTALGGVYNLTAGDISKRRLELILASTNNGVCPPGQDTLTVDVILFPKITLAGDTTICQNQRPFYLSGNLLGGSGSLQWTSSGTGTFLPNQFSNPVSYIFGEADLPLSSINIALTSKDNGPCGNVSVATNINILPTPEADFSASQYSITLPSDPIVFTNLSKGGKSYRWNFGDGATSTAQSPSYIYPKVGFYTVELIVTNQFLCRDTASKVLTVISDIVFPNAFTPNPNASNGGSYSRTDFSDGLNDVFFPFTGGVVEYDLMIFNRWGELLFRSDDLDRGWDGYFNGKLCQQDAYVWKANVKFFDGRTFNKTGSVTLLR